MSFEKMSAIIHKTAWISMFNQSGDVREWIPTMERKSSGLYSQHAPEPSLYLFFLRKNTHAPHGFHGSGRSSAECELLWTRLMWRYPAPGTQQKRRHKPWSSVSGECKQQHCVLCEQFTHNFLWQQQLPALLPCPNHMSTVISTVQSLSWKSHSETQAHKSMKGATASGS